MIKYFLIHVLVFMCSFSAFSQTCQPNELYDQIVSDFHSTVARRQDGALIVWGEKKAANGISHVLKPQEINSVNYPGLTGKPLRATLGSRNGGAPVDAVCQAILLTTTGLFVWGDRGTIIGSALTTSSTFQKITVAGKLDGLPAAVSPLDVKIMTATFQSLSIVTKVGEVWILGVESSMYGDGTSVATNTWHQVQSSIAPYKALGGIVQFRMCNLMSFAVDSNNVWYTWGTRVVNQSAISTGNRALVLTKPSALANELPKMIAATSQNITGPQLVTYFALSQNGALYSMGDNSPALTRSTNTYSWMSVKKNSVDDFTNVMYISAQDNDARFMAVAAITSDNNLWAWGENNYSMLGGLVEETVYNYPHSPNGFTMNQDKANYVEMGGHTLVYAKDGSDHYCYVGHRINGSMGDGTVTDAVESSLNCTNTAAVPLCSLCPGTSNNSISKNQTVCEGYPITEFDSKAAILTNNNSVFYQWQSSIIGKDTAFKDIAQAKNKNYKPAPLAKTTWYRRIVKNATPNCPVDSSNVLFVYVNPVPLIPLVVANQSICVGDSIVLNASAATGVKFNWTGPNSFTSLSTRPVIYDAGAENSGAYNLRVTDIKNCSSALVTTTITVHVIDLKITTEPSICEGRSINFEVQNPISTWTYLWTGPDNFISDKPTPIVSNAGSKKMGLYTVTVRNEQNCKQVESITMSLAECEDRFTIPEGFSPNGDGINDVLIIQGLKNYPNHSITLFNRWGQKVYHAAPYENNWQGMSQYGLVVGVGAGELLPEGTYFYLLDKNNGEEPVKGSIYLKR